MLTDFFKVVKKWCVYLGVLMVTLSCVYACVYQNAVLVQCEKEFYFLVSENLNVQVGAYVTALQGGAGYLLQTEECEYVAYHVYFSYESAKRAQNNLSDGASIIHLGVHDLTLKTRIEKEKRVALTNYLHCIDGCMQVLDAEITRLECGATQQSSKRILQILNRQLQYLEEEYGGFLPHVSDMIDGASVVIANAVEGIVYAKDLRYALCVLSVGYIQLCEEYSL